MLAAFIGIVSLLYATVGQAGGTAFLALMAFAALPSSEMRPTALTLNIVAATYSTWIFSREKVIDWKKLRRLLISSLPMALIGGCIVLNEHFYKIGTGIVLLLACASMAIPRDGVPDADHETAFWRVACVGAVVGLVSGLTGVGGGIFLAPVLIGLGWASPRQTAALSSPFILANSVVGLAATLFVGQLPDPHVGWYAMAALGGSIVGTTVGLRWLSQAATKLMLAGILFAAGIQLVFF
jgi:hypothetical protein